MKLTISTAWTSEERVAVATALLGIIQSDIPAGLYGRPGRPNVDSVLGILHEDAEVLNQHRGSLDEMLERISDRPSSGGVVSDGKGDRSSASFTVSTGILVRRQALFQLKKAARECELDIECVGDGGWLRSEHHVTVRGEARNIKRYLAAVDQWLRGMKE